VLLQGRVQAHAHVHVRVWVRVRVRVQVRVRVNVRVWVVAPPALQLKAGVGVGCSKGVTWVVGLACRKQFPDRGACRPTRRLWLWDGVQSGRRWFVPRPSRR